MFDSVRNRSVCFMSKAQITRAHIIEQAAAVFNRQGYAGASMQDLMQATGLQKGGIYNHFSSKDELAIAAFDFATNHIQQKFMGALKGKRRAVDRLMAMLDVYETLLDDPLVPGGCPILNTAVESDDTHPGLRDRAQQAMDTWRKLLRRILESGISRGELRSGIEVENVITVLIATIEGAIMLSKLYGETVYLERALEHLRSYVREQLAEPS
jgi:TetR/AcrR family transcriptional regulator, transcriptional repressor for nem operon